METNAVEREKICHKCQAVFSCCTENCWCSKLPQIMPLSVHEDCLCYSCLKIEIDKKIEAAHLSDEYKAMVDTMLEEENSVPPLLELSPTSPAFRL
jgi:hypothetical protein